MLPFIFAVVRKLCCTSRGLPPIIVQIYSLERRSFQKTWTIAFFLSPRSAVLISHENDDSDAIDFHRLVLCRSSKYTSYMLQKHSNLHNKHLETAMMHFSWLQNYDDLLSAIAGDLSSPRVICLLFRVVFGNRHCSPSHILCTHSVPQFHRINHHYTWMTVIRAKWTSRWSLIRLDEMHQIRNRRRLQLIKGWCI